jgi:hypothetical protein
MSRLAVLIVLMGTVSACQDGTGTSGLPNATILPGTYVLESVQGRGPNSGTFEVTRGGAAERRVRYSTAIEYVAIGSYMIVGDSIVFALRENGGQSEYVWRPRGAVTGARFTLRHPDPADGPDIVETYRRR